MADFKIAKTGGLTTGWPSSSSSYNASSAKRPPEMFTRIAGKDTLSLRAKKTQDVRWSERKYVIANPESFSESVAPQYSRRPVLGLSHEVVQYIRTASREIDLELWCSYHVIRQNNGSLSADQALDKLMEYRNFIESLTVPSGPRLAPPLVHVNWPGARLNFKGVVTDLSIDYTRFAHNGAPTEFTVGIGFLEVRRGLMTHDTVRDMGFGTVFDTSDFWGR